MHLDSENRLWATTAEGLFRGTDNKQPEAGIAGGGNGRFWLAGNEGLFHWDHGQWTRYGVKDGLKADATSHVLETPDGEIWVSYRESPH